MNEKNVMEAFKLFARLNVEGQILKEEAQQGMNDEVRGLLAEFANEVNCCILSAGAYIYLIPLTVHSEYHLTNREIKRDYLPSRATNMDMYLMYLGIIVFIGEFYDSYQNQEPTREFITVNGWMDALHQRIQGLKQLDEKVLIDLEKDYEYNWTGMICHWDSMDIVKETVKKQTAKTNSRLSFMHITKEFMLQQGLIVECGPDELGLSEKAKVITQRFFMDYEYNRGILEVIYQYSQDDVTLKHQD